jgi:hypothetical protein
MKIQTYGKTNQLTQIALNIQSAFKINAHANNYWESKGCETYLPRLKKRFYLATATSVVLCTPLVPGGVAVVYPIMRWGLR